MKKFRKWQKKRKKQVEDIIESYMRSRTRIRDVVRATDFRCEVDALLSSVPPKDEKG